MTPDLAASLLLAVGLIGSALTWNLFRPIRSGRRLPALSWLAGWLYGEFVPLQVLAQAALCAGLVAGGALDAARGGAGAVLVAGAWIGMLVHYAGGLRSARAIDGALQAALGSDVPPARDATIAWRDLLWPVPRRPAGVERIANVVYHEQGGLRLQLDLYRPKRATQRAPILLYIHGGAWVIGTKSTQGLPIMHHMAERGWLCANANYRLSPRATFPDHIIDVKRAVRWLKQNAERFGGDPDFIAIAGGSAGGHLAALHALTHGEAEYQPGFEDEDLRVRAAIPIYGVFDWTDAEHPWHDELLRPMIERLVLKKRLRDEPEAFRRASPLHRVHTEAPPFFLIHGDSDSLVSPDESRAFQRALARHSRAPVGYAEIPGAQHAFELFPSLRSALVRRGIERFLVALHARATAAAAPAAPRH